ncbi:MAG TPA: fimbria/pilus outer membrane usher protein, partial [Gammaproteobacteria bacterium]
FNLGPTAVVRHNRWGLFSSALAMSSSALGRRGWAGAAGYGYTEQGFTLQGNLRRYSSAYERVGREADDVRPRQELIAAIGYGVRALGSVGVSTHRTDAYQGVGQRVTSLNYSRTLYRTWHLMAGMDQISNDQSSRFFHISLSYHPGPAFTAALSHRKKGGDYGDTLQIGNTMPVGEGLGYRLVADRSVDQGGERVRFAPWAQYNGQHAIYSAAVQHTELANRESATGYQLGVSGGIGYVAGRAAFSRPIRDSFALVDVGDLQGVRIYQGAQLMGTTEADGSLFLPGLSSYVVNRISVDDRDIPIDYTLAVKELGASPPLRSGSLLDFEVKRFQAVLGRLLVKLDGAWRPAAYGDLTMAVQGDKRSIPIGRDGEVYIEDLLPGLSRVRYERPGERCEFELSIPAAKEMLNDLGEVHGCEVAH